MPTKPKAMAGFGRMFLAQSLITLVFLAALGAIGYTLTMLAQR